MAKSFGLQRLLDDFRHRRERFRQFLGIAYVILVSVVGQPKPFLFWLGTVLVIPGIAVRMWASGHIKKNKELATDGPYAYVRHPLYVGNFLIAFGFALACGLWWALPLLVLFLAVFYPPAIRSEDDKLHRLFGEEWEQWNRVTRALLPRFAPFRPGQRGSWSFTQSLKQNGEPIIALFLLSCLYLLLSGLP